MANAQTSGNNKEYATVDTTPGASGYWTNAVNMRGKGLSYMFFSIRGTGTATVTLQFRCDGDAAWTDYNNEGTDFVTGDRKIIEGTSGGTSWRAGVKDDAAYTSGSVSFGFDW